MSYHSLPVDGAAGLSLKNVKALDQLLKQAGDEKVFLHCASGNRVGALMALRSALIYGENTEAAIAQGKAWGLTRLEPELKRLMGGFSWGLGGFNLALVGLLLYRFQAAQSGFTCSSPRRDSAW